MTETAFRAAIRTFAPPDAPGNSLATSENMLFLIMIGAIVPDVGGENLQAADVEPIVRAGIINTSLPYNTTLIAANRSNTG